MTEKKFLQQLIFFILSLLPFNNYAQFTNTIWCFGDSAGIDFRNGAVPIMSGMIGRNGSTTICDSMGNLLFYCYGGDKYLQDLGLPHIAIVKSKNHLTMQNGEQLIAHWYHDMIIIPKSVSDSTFYIFSAGITSEYGLWYNLVDLKQNNGLGAVIQKNIQLDTFPVYDGLTAIKHGNGRDWWLICQRWDVTVQTVNNDFYVYKIDSSGISAVNLQNVGSLHNNSSGDLSFNSNGTKMIYAEWRGLVELYDFDRYTGVISNPITIEPERPVNPYPYYISSVISPNGRFLYLTSYQISYHKACKLYQYDLQAPNISITKTLIDSLPSNVGSGIMELGPDKKIYVTGFDESYGYPYPDTLHNYITDNLSVINSPDSLGLACDFQPFSFYLGGRRVFIGLPNNPDYTLGPLDTITAVHEIKQPALQNELKVFYHPTWDVAFINADKLTGRKYTLSLFDITGKLIFREQGNLNSQYFTKDLSMQRFAQGVYIATLETDKERLNKRFVK